MSAGRSCPLSYRYSPEVFRTAASARVDSLYIAGGLYGNEQALDVVLRLFEAERGNKRLVFNGDFNWFNVDPASFRRINEAVLGFDAMRGNVETELGPRTDGMDEMDADEGAVGCGCGYPEWVDDGVVARSNAIMKRLAATAAGFPALQRQLATLPMWRRFDVGGLPVGVVHGDAESLAGWGFSRERLADENHAATVRQWFEDAGVRIFACSHTCAPVLHAVDDVHARSCLVANNGAAGMPNFSDDFSGLLTRIATTPWSGLPSRSSARVDHLFIDAVPIAYDNPRWQAAFLQQWPPGSPAHISYWERIALGTAESSERCQTVRQTSA